MKKPLFITFLIIIAVLVIGCAGKPPAVTPKPVTLEAEKTTLLTGEHTFIQCRVSDSDNDLSYQWLSSGGKIEGEGTSIDWFAPDEAGNYVITVKVNGDDGENRTASITISVRENQPPTISELTSSEEDIIPGGSYTIECLASDADGDPLIYEWEADGGIISGKGDTVTWTAPDAEGTYTITVTVSDGMGAEATCFVSLNVAANHVPEIKDLTATPHNPRHMKGNKIFKGESCDIECVASDEDEDKLTYSWSCDRGNIQGSGCKVTWTAPDAYCHAVTITATVSDGRGGTDSKEIVFEVVTCLCNLD